jgi:hypothetical protein
VDEPFPVKATIRGEEYRALIVQEADKIGVLEEAKVNRDELKPGGSSKLSFK